MFGCLEEDVINLMRNDARQRTAKHGGTQRHAQRIEHGPESLDHPLAVDPEEGQNAPSMAHHCLGQHVRSYRHDWREFSNRTTAFKRTDDKALELVFNRL